MTTLLIIAIILIIAWPVTYWGGPETWGTTPVRGNNLLHVILVIGVILLLFSLLGGPCIHVGSGPLVRVR